jgi:hypothetical protein
VTTLARSSGIGRRLSHDVVVPRFRWAPQVFPDATILRIPECDRGPNRSFRRPAGCGKHEPKSCKGVPIVNKPVEKVTTIGQKFLKSPIDPTPAQKFWHSITRSSRSTCRMRRRTERGFGSGGERGLARGTELLQRAAEFGPRSVTTNDVKCQPSCGGLSDTGQRMMCLREPRGAGELRLTGHSGFSAFQDQNSGRDSIDSINSGPSFLTDPTAELTP